MGGTRNQALRATGQRQPIFLGPSICPAEGKGAGLVLPSCNSEAIALHLEEISLAVAPGAHALVLLDQAGWHVSKKLPVQHYPRSIAAKVTRLEPSRKYLAVHTRQLALEPGFQILRRHPRSLLPRLEQAYQHALENYVHRNKRMGLSVVISETWYQSPRLPGAQDFVGRRARDEAKWQVPRGRQALRLARPSA